MIEPEYREIYRYLGYRGISPDEETDRRIRKCVADLNRVITPKNVYESFPLETGNGCVRFAGLEVRSSDLIRNLKDSTRITMLAVTIGHGVDKLIRRAEVSDMLDAAIFQAAGAAMVESYIDTVNEQIRQEAKAEGYSLRPRFSPGYGDLPLSMQTDFERILKMSRNCGIALTDTYLMVPSKSVTALIGMTLSTEDACSVTGCETCNLASSCEFKKG